jgi:3-oxoacyl-[acyl-carrier-protein] synthase-3
LNSAKSFPFSIDTIEFVLGEKKIDLEKYIKNFNRTVEITGIKYVYETNNSATDLAIAAAKKCLKNYQKKIEALIYITQSPDYYLPGSATLIHNELRLQDDCMTLDINSGCSGFAQAILLGSQIINQYKNILIICSDTYRKKIAKDDRSTFAVFSDGASAIILSDDPKINIEKKIIKTYGAGVEMLYQPFQGDIKMKGKELWDFTRTRVVPDINLLINHATNQDNFNEKINIYMHQASKVVVEGISAQLDIKKTKIFKNYEDIGNTVSSSIPILIKEKNFKEINEKKSIISGFGVGIMSYNLLLTPCL